MHNPPETTVLRVAMRRFGLLRNAVLVRGEGTMIAESVAQTHTIRMGSDRLSIITAGLVGLVVPSAVWQRDGRALKRHWFTVSTPPTFAGPGRSWCC